MALKLSGPASALLLLAALLAAGARADRVTTAECKADGRGARVRRYPVDNNATGLYMYGCMLTGVEQRALTGLPALTVLSLWGNKLRELPVLDEHVCANLAELYLNNNQLTEINAGAFSAYKKLEILRLGDNQIHFIHLSVFTALTNLKCLHLYNNKIRFIPDQMFSNNDKLERLYLHGNMISHLPPEFASKLKRAGTGLYSFHFEGNPWQCACLIELLVDVRRAGVGDYYKVKYAGRARVCVYTGAYPCSRPAPTGLLGGRGGC